MDQITIDYQLVQQRCAHCGSTFNVTRGSVYEAGEGVAIYLAALHACQGGKLAHVAIALRPGYQGAQDRRAIALKVWPTATEFQMAVVDAHESPWQNEVYLDHLMDREEALASPLLDTLFHIVNHVVAENPKLSGYLDN
jgi:hypothetical protein